MDNNTPNNNTPVTLEEITRRKNEKKEEVRKLKAQMTQTMREMFAPEENKGGAMGIVQHIGTGIAVYDGIMTGIKVMRRVRGFFTRKRR